MGAVGTGPKLWATTVLLNVMLPRRRACRSTSSCSLSVSPTVLPVLGGIYTVRDIFDAAPYGYDEPGLLLAD